MTEFEVPAWVTGVLLCVLGTVLTALGLVLQKYSHINNAKTGDHVVYFRQPWWIGGFAVFLLGQVLNLGAMSLAPQTMLSCLGACSLVFNAVFAWIILSECTQMLEVLAMAGTIVGVVLVIHSTPARGMSRMEGLGNLEPLREVGFLVLTGVMIFFTTVLGFAVCFWWQEFLPVFWSLVSAVLSAYTVTLFKCLSMLFVSQRPPWPWLEPYFIFGLALFLCVGQVHTLNLALNRGRAMTVVPTSFAFGLLAQITTAAMAFRELSDFQGSGQVATFIFGLALILACIVAAVREKVSAIDVVKAEVVTPLIVHTTRPEEVENPPKSVPRGASCSSFDADAFPDSFEGRERSYTVSVAGPIGIA